MDVVFELEVESGNAAFGPTEIDARAEVARILRDVAARIERGCDGVPVFDVNGNRVGDFHFGAEPQET